MHAGQEDTLGNLNSEVSSLRAEISGFRGKLEQHAQRATVLEEEKIALSTRVEDLQGQLAAAGSGLVELEKLKSVQEERDGLDQTLKAVQEERDGLFTERDRALAEVEALKAEAVVDKNRMEDLEQRGEELDGRLQELERELEIKIAEGATLGEHLAAIKAESARQVHELESKIVELESRAEAAEAKVEAAEEKLQEAEHNFQASNSRTKELEQVRYHGSHGADHFVEDS